MAEGDEEVEPEPDFCLELLDVVRLPVLVEEVLEPLLALADPVGDTLPEVLELPDNEEEDEPLMPDWLSPGIEFAFEPVPDIEA